MKGNNMPIDIIKDEYKMQSQIFNFKEVGDSVQGTFVRKSEAKSKFSGLIEPLYEIKTEKGEFYTIWGKPIIRQQMERVTLGQIVGFKLVEKRKTEKGNPASIIEVYAREDVVDEEWLKKHEQGIEEEVGENVDVEEIDFGEVEDPRDKVKKEDVPFESDAPPVGVVEEDKGAQALALAQAKYGLSNENEIKNKVMNETNLAWIEMNYDKIIEYLNK